MQSLLLLYNLSLLLKLLLSSYCAYLCCWSQSWLLNPGSATTAFLYYYIHYIRPLLYYSKVQYASAILQPVSTTTAPLYYNSMSLHTTLLQYSLSLLLYSLSLLPQPLSATTACLFYYRDVLYLLLESDLASCKRSLTHPSSGFLQGNIVKINNSLPPSASVLCKNYPSPPSSSSIALVKQWRRSGL